MFRLSPKSCDLTNLLVRPLVRREDLGLSARPKVSPRPWLRRAHRRRNRTEPQGSQGRRPLLGMGVGRQSLRRFLVHVSLLLYTYT